MNTDLRAARTFRMNLVSLRAIIDAFTVFDANTVLVRNNNVRSTGATGFNSIAQNRSPRIFRVGVVVGF